MGPIRAACALVLLLGLQARTPPGIPADGTHPAPPDLNALARSVHETLLREYRAEQRYTYVEKRRDVDISRLGKVSIGPLRTFEVYPRTFGPDYKRLIEIEGKPLDPAELARRDEEHRRNVAKQAERDRLEPPQRRAARLKRDQEELTAIVNDAARVFAFENAGHETIDGEPVTVVTLKPRANAHVTTREGDWMKKMEGRLWIADAGHHVARIRLRAIDDLSIGWGVVARVDPGSGFEYVRKRIGSDWVPLELTVEGSGRTLLFRRFTVKTVTTYTQHQRWDPKTQG
jgi:hypothetical protein